MLEGTVSQQAVAQLPVLLEPLAEIRSTPSETVDQIKKKERLYKVFENRRGPFRLLADVWASAFVERNVTDEHYKQAVDAVGQPRNFAAIAEQDWFTQAIAHAHCADFDPFHWELEFLEIFFGESGRRADAGFDAVIGNPPYEVLSELESGRDLAAFRRFIEREPVYEPSRTGKNNLYKLFICRALELLAEGGYMGFITPMSLLGDDSTASLRKRIASVASFTGIDAFPQKDNPAKRVFQDAKLSTTVFTLQGTADYDQSFPARVHSGRMIEANSPAIQLRASEIGLYDPANFTIVCCSQRDWDLAVRIMRSGA